MDVSDVAYNRFLINGKTEIEETQYKAGDKIKLHVVNGSSSTYYWIQFAGGKITAVANDGMDVVPVDVDRMIIAVAETYDIIITIPDNMSYELKATSGQNKIYINLIGTGMKIMLRYYQT